MNRIVEHLGSLKGFKGKPLDSMEHGNELWVGCKTTRPLEVSHIKQILGLDQFRQLNFVEARQTEPPQVHSREWRIELHPTGLFLIYANKTLSETSRNKLMELLILIDRAVQSRRARG